MSFNDNKGLWLGAAVLTMLAGVLLWILATAEPFRLIVLFNDVGDLKREDPVVWKGFKIGMVEEIKPLVDNQIGVTIRLNEEYAPKITHGSEFILKRASLLGLFGDNAIEVVTPSVPGTPFSGNEKVQGKSPGDPTILEKSKKWSKEYWQRINDQVGSLIDAFQNSPQRTEADAALNQIKTLANDGMRQAKGELEQFWRVHQKDLNEAVSKLEHIGQEARKGGSNPDEHSIQKQIENLKDNLR